LMATSGRSHDLRHSSITNAAAAGTSPEALMSRAVGACGAAPVPNRGTKTAIARRRKQRTNALSGSVERRGWDLNPRCPAKGTAVFKTAPFDRSGTPP
jgi:hypothetical protein